MVSILAHKLITNLLMRLLSNIEGRWYYQGHYSDYQVCLVESQSQFAFKGLHLLLDDDGTWALSTNKLTWYQLQDGNDEYTPNMMRISHRDSTVFTLEAAVSQHLSVLRRKVEQILADEDVFGVLVIRVAEASRRSEFFDIFPLTAFLTVFDKSLSSLKRLKMA
jgi:hypothetical protein